MKIRVNGKAVDLEGQVSIAEFLHDQGVDEAIALVEYNLQVVSRADWGDLILKEDDRLEVVQLLGGG